MPPFPFPVDPPSPIKGNFPTFAGVATRIVGSLRGMQIETLDHIALWVGDRDELTEFLVDRMGMHVIDRTDKFTLVGADARRGKLTLFAAEPERAPGPLARIGLRVFDLDEALAELPPDLAVERPEEGRVEFEGPQRIPFALVVAEDGVAYDLDHVAFRVADPETTFAQLAELGFDVVDDRLKAGDAFVELEQGETEEPERPLLNHLGLRVESADHHIREAEERGLEIADIVDAANTYAVFVWGPDRIKLEYVEHKPTFSLV
jgi:catechol 2,3-dioxygenase-like lactoylglutathione lyase family enzyme